MYAVFFEPVRSGSIIRASASSLACWLALVALILLVALLFLDELLLLGALRIPNPSWLGLVCRDEMALLKPEFELRCGDVSKLRRPEPLL